MKKHRISTTISAKHWNLLEKYTERFETQQKALEHVLENFDDEGNNKVISPEDKLKSKLIVFKPLCYIHKDIFLELFRTADYKQLCALLISMKIAEYQLIIFYEKPIKDLSLKEVVEGIVVTSRSGNWLETLEYKDDGSCYTIIATHNAKNINFSKMFSIFFDSLFESYGAKTESTETEHSLFMKVFKAQR